MITLEPNYQLDFRNSGSFSELLGFNEAIVTTTLYSDNLSDITRSIDNIFIHTNIISNSIVSGVHSEVFTDSVLIIYPYYIHLISLREIRALYSKINTSIIKEIRIYLTDALNRPINLNNIPISMILIYIFVKSTTNKRWKRPKSLF